MTTLMIAVLGLLVVAAVAALAPRVRIAAPLLLVLLGIGVSFLPFVPPVHVDPEWILAGVLPPLLYSASVSMPSMNFRRDLTAISGLSVVLVVLSSVVVGVFFAWAVPELGLWWGIALGAVVSPTDAVATSIVKQVGVSGRVVAVLEGESLLNDATALVLLRAAIAGAASTVSLWGVVGDFAYAVAIAVVLGIVVGQLNLRVRSQVTDATVNTVMSFTVPFLASIPAELLGASGLVAAVVAGLVTGYGAARRLPPLHRWSDGQNWRAIELVLEGAIFLVMGLELAGIVADVQGEHSGIRTAVAVAAGALGLTVVVRAAYVGPLLAVLRHRAHRGEQVKPQLGVMQHRLDHPGDVGPDRVPGGHDGDHGPGRWRPRRRRISPQRAERLHTRIRRSLADIDYLLAAPLGWRDGAVLVWAGMRGAVTLAAAQTLPDYAPNRSLLILTAFLVAVASLLLQGTTLAAVVARIGPKPVADGTEVAEHEQIMALMADVIRRTSNEAGFPADTFTGQSPGGDGTSGEWKRVALSVVAAQRAVLLDARDDGIYSAETLNHALANLDAHQISIELKGGPPDR